MDTSKIAPVVLRDYNFVWPDMFETEKNLILGVIGEDIISIEHIGSTSIPGMIAKPEIDILIGVSDLSKVEPCVIKLKDIAYAYYPRFEEFEPRRRYFRKSDGIVPLVHVHLYQENTSEYRERLLFRDFLRQHPEEAATYAAYKTSLLQTLGSDRLAYSDAKERFVLDMLENLRKVTK